MLQTGKQKLREVTLLTQIHQVVSWESGDSDTGVSSTTPWPSHCITRTSTESFCPVLLGSPPAGSHGTEGRERDLKHCFLLPFPAFCFRSLFLPHALTAARAIHQKHTPCPSLLTPCRGFPFSEDWTASSAPPPGPAGLSSTTRGCPPGSPPSCTQASLLFPKGGWVPPTSQNFPERFSPRTLFLWYLTLHL